ncbi:MULTISPECIES: TMEM165/GDT1 family protein [Oceanimonas]|uniref:GDT1 family protein n=1 Tax=Oceanimonas doudoroffii TaxID=84158 RepID=A0A233RF71_9GAMM|nr:MULTISPECIES: TMEM165/GDT1 family protein [Oceanimonas]NHI01554.1 hypothetical protein [Oceanimonas sp. MB9]OXY82045.1 hypothetical protein B6S08_00470 [Oceanimonas doudoroffii]
MEALTTSTLAVSIAEIGDKTQLLALILACRFRKPLPIIWGIFLATLINHALAGSVGIWIQSWLDPQWLRWLLALSFFAMAAWMLIPDKADDEDSRFYRLGPFVATFVLFFLAEIGDKTQIATTLLAARFVDEFWLVVAGTTLGMMVANLPAVLAGHKGAGRLPMHWIHGASALIFLVLGVTTLWWPWS